MSNSFALVPGGGLIAHEQAGGHTLAKHVGLTEAQLLSRLAHEPVPIASCFTNSMIAETVIAEALAADQTFIANWLNGQRPKLQLNLYDANRPVGISIIRGTIQAIPVSKVQVILKRDANFLLGYYIITAFPQP